MARKQKLYHFIYKTTNLLSGRYYIGMHSTDNLEDGYLGSGYLISRAIKKHGKENFSRVILEFCSSREELKKRESEIVTLSEIAKKECMNLQVGGGGGFSSEEHRKKFFETVNYEASHKIIKWLRENDEDWYKEYCKKISDSHKRINFNHANFKNKKHTNETKSNLSNSMKGKYDGDKNPSYGTCWITKEDSNKKIKVELLVEYESNGWCKGRKINIIQ
jgi:hypothetical protein